MDVVWFVGSLIRRIIDLRCGYLTPGPWTMTPILVTAISILTLLKYLPKAHKIGGLPFVFASAACVYGYLINLINQGISDIDQGSFLLIAWLCPIAFGFHLLVHWRNYPEYRQNFLRTFLWGVLFMGLYGLIQYAIAPPWDTFWLKAEQAQGKALSYGEPKPFGIRLASSMDAPQPFASMMGSGLILLFCVRGSQKLWANGLGYLSFLLSLARSGWLSWLFGTFVFFSGLKSNLKIRMLVGILMTILIILPITAIEPFSEVIGERIESLSDTEDDGSLRSRNDAFNLLIGHALVEFVGYGLQSPITPNVKLSSIYVVGDNGILILLFALGWIGAFPYILSVVTIIFQLQKACLKNNDLLLYAGLCSYLGTS